jgi:5-methylcytosine-specific restriction endonuclease McrA
MKKMDITPRSRIRSTLRMLWLRSRERAAALRMNKRTCFHCGVKASTAKGREQKVEVHHIAGIANWEKVIDSIYKELLVKPENLMVICPECHDEIHKGVNNETK